MPAGVSHSFGREVVGEGAVARENPTFSLIRILREIQRGCRVPSGATDTETAFGEEAAAEINIDFGGVLGRRDGFN